MASFINQELIAVKELFHLTGINAFMSVTTYLPYEDIFNTISTFFEKNKEHYEILSIDDKIIDSEYCKKDKMRAETRITITCKPYSKPIIDKQLQKINNYKEAAAIERSDDFKFYIYINEFNYINNEGDHIAINFVEFNYYTITKTDLFKIAYNKMKKIFSNDIPSLVDCKINYEGEIFRDYYVNLTAKQSV